MTNLFESLAFLCVVAGMYELAGKGWALLAAAPLLLVIAFALEGLHPLQLIKAVVADMRVLVIRKMKGNEPSTTA